MNDAGGAATQICSQRFDHRFFSLPLDIQRRIQARIDELGRNLRSFSHHRMQGVAAFRLRVGDYRVIYDFNIQKNELFLVSVGNRREIYRSGLN